MCVCDLVLLLKFLQQANASSTSSPALEPYLINVNNINNVNVNGTAAAAVCRPPSPPRKSILREWGAKKFHDERAQRLREAAELEREIRLREQARHNRVMEDEERRRMLLGLEGLVLERRVPPKEEFPGQPNSPQKNGVRLFLYFMDAFGVNQNISRFSKFLRLIREFTEFPGQPIRKRC